MSSYDDSYYSDLGSNSFGGVSRDESYVPPRYIDAVNKKDAPALREFLMEEIGKNREMRAHLKAMAQRAEEYSLESNEDPQEMYDDFHRNDFMRRLGEDDEEDIAFMASKIDVLLERRQEYYDRRDDADQFENIVRDVVAGEYEHGGEYAEVVGRAWEDKIEATVKAYTDEIQGLIDRINEQNQTKESIEAETNQNYETIDQLRDEIDSMRETIENYKNQLQQTAGNGEQPDMSSQTSFEWPADDDQFQDSSPTSGGDYNEEEQDDYGTFSYPEEDDLESFRPDNPPPYYNEEEQGDYEPYSQPEYGDLQSFPHESHPPSHKMFASPESSDVDDSRDSFEGNIPDLQYTGADNFQNYVDPGTELYEDLRDAEINDYDDPNQAVEQDEDYADESPSLFNLSGPFNEDDRFDNDPHYTRPFPADEQDPFDILMDEDEPSQSIEDTSGEMMRELDTSFKHFNDLDIDEFGESFQESSDSEG